VAAHLLGYLGEISSKELESGRFTHLKMGEYVGKFGVERRFESYLAGERGGRQVEVSSSGQVVRTLKTVPPIPGKNLNLTIDLKLQQVAEAALGMDAGAVVAIDPNNGEVLTLASTPAFNQNDFISGLTNQKWQALIHNPQKPMNNKAVQGGYPPGSTYKIVTALAGLEEKVIDANTSFFCPGQFQFGKRTFRCWRRGGHGHVSLKKALAESCDVYFYQVGLKLGVDKLAKYANALGLGKPTGIELANENSGLIPTAAWKKERTGISWQRGETLSIAIGQGFNSTTPLQMAVVTAAVANGGTLHRPTLIKNSEAINPGTKLPEDPPNDRFPVSQHNLRLVQNGLWEVVNGKRGTARIAKIPGVEICGKTGTAQVFTRKTQADLKEEDLEKSLRSHAWFVAYAPNQNPQIAVSVLVEHGAHGSSSAAPIAKKVIASYLGISLEPDVAEKTE
jgi:penicillin-binding protein 2